MRQVRPWAGAPCALPAASRCLTRRAYLSARLVWSVYSHSACRSRRGQWPASRRRTTTSARSVAGRGRASPSADRDTCHPTGHGQPVLLGQGAARRLPSATAAAPPPPAAPADAAAPPCCCPPCSCPSWPCPPTHCSSALYHTDQALTDPTTLDELHGRAPRGTGAQGPARPCAARTEAELPRALPQLPHPQHLRRRRPGYVRRGTRTFVGA
jgi:hypothetical protein